jgi:hypothetical protein
MVLGLITGFNEHFNTQLMTTLYRSLAHKDCLFSVTVFTAVLGNVFQQWMFFCSRLMSLQAGSHFTPTSYYCNCHLKTLVMAAGPCYIASTQITQKIPLPAVLLLGDIAALLDRTEPTVPLLCVHSLLADELFTLTA